MVFSSAVFMLIFLPITAIGYYLLKLICKNKLTIPNIWLLLVSLMFYAWGEPVYVLLMIASITINYGLGLWVSKCPKTPKGKRIIALACVLNLGVLFFFKYLHWLIGLVSGGTLSVFNVALPIGISFYTFQAMSYVIDVYRGKDKAQTNIINVGLYIAFFPQLIAGPIVRYGTIAEQLKQRAHNWDKFSEGAWRFGIGLAKKTLLANQLAQLADLTFDGNTQLSVVLAWGGALAYLLQVYFDFSGYSDMAIGLGKMFGFEFNENFNYPYISKSVGEYWRRWHISLGEWFRDYMFYPLTFGPAVKVRKWGGKHFSRRTATLIASSFVSLVIWFSTGLWHGANITFVIWGVLQFVVIFLEQFRKPFKSAKWDAVFGFTYTFLFGMLTKVIFRADTISKAFQYLGNMIGVTGNAFVDKTALYWLGQYASFLVLGLLFAFPIIPFINRLSEKYHFKMAWDIVKCVALFACFVFSLSYAISGGYNPFIYFNF